jgi:two-component system sensor histidine kinase CpxA
MRSLFFRIFVSFWFAMTLITAGFGLIYLTLSTDSKWERWQFLHEHSLQAQVESQRAELEHATPAALAAFASELQARTDLRLSVIAPGTTDAAVPESARALVEQALATNQRQHQKGEKGAYFVEPLSGAAEGYVLLGELKRPSTLLWFIGAETLPVRLVVILVVSGVVCYLLALHLTQRIRVIRKGARRLAAGDLSARIGPLLGDGSDEADALGHDLDQMAERIEALLGAQQRLLRDVSHELRSPLARLTVALELARQGSTQPALAEHHDRIAKEADRLGQLIGEVLTLTRLEGEAQQDRQAMPLDLSELLDEIARDADFEAKPHQRRVQVESEARVTILGFAEILRGAVENVVRNAVRFAPQDSEVEVRLTRATEEGRRWAKIFVRDRGPGVPEAALEAIFQPFFRVSESRNRRSGGSGVGLAITERAVRLHGGTVKASNADGGGLLVAISLPLQHHGELAAPS